MARRRQGKALPHLKRTFVSRMFLNSKCPNDLAHRSSYQNTFAPQESGGTEPHAIFVRPILCRYFHQEAPIIQPSGLIIARPIIVVSRPWRLWKSTGSLVSSRSLILAPESARRGLVTIIPRRGCTKPRRRCLEPTTVRRCLVARVVCWCTRGWICVPCGLLGI